jgi:phosphoglycerate dehydrogenase-like enzyme
MIPASSDVAAPPLRLAIDLGPYKFTPDVRAVLERSLGPIDALSGDQSCDADVLLTEFVPKEVGAWPNLKLIQLTSAGIDHLDGHPIWQAPIPVATASGIGHVSIAQYCLAMILNHYHRLPQAMTFVQTRVWPDRLKLASRTLPGQTACIYGYGSIGRECGRLVRALGLNVLAVNRSGRASGDDGYNAYPGTGDPEGSIPAAWFSSDRLGEAMERSQVLIITAPATAATRGRVEAATLARMPRGAFVVVVSRGGIIDEISLADALRSGHLAGAAIDTFVKEPPPADHPLFGLPNVILTPHISGVFDDYMGRIYPLLIENIRRVRSGRRPLNVVE